VTDFGNLSDLAAYAQEQGEGESPGRLVRARTGPGGRLLDLHLSPDTMRLSPQDAAAEISAAVLAAQTDYATRADAIMEPILALRPSDQATDMLDAGMRRLDELAADLDRLARRQQR
jgi:hypothetical protein